MNHKERIAKTLTNLNGDLIAADRKAVMKALKISKSTLSKYMHGNVIHIDVALNIVTLLTSRLKAREKQIKALCQPLNNDSAA